MNYLARSLKTFRENGGSYVRVGMIPNDEHPPQMVSQNRKGFRDFLQNSGKQAPSALFEMADAQNG